MKYEEVLAKAQESAKNLHELAMDLERAISKAMKAAGIEEIEVEDRKYCIRQLGCNLEYDDYFVVSYGSEDFFLPRHPAPTRDEYFCHGDFHAPRVVGTTNDVIQFIEDVPEIIYQIQNITEERQKVLETAKTITI